MTPLIAGLLRPDAYPHPAPAPRLIETHISWVILAGDYAYKLKKPLDLGFLDFSSLDKRRACCEAEIRLNRRLAPDIYLGVVPVTGATDAPRLGGEGPVLEWAVKMRAFPADATLDREAQVTVEQIDAIADRVAAFHDAVAVAPADSAHGLPDEVMAPIAANFTHLRALPTPADLLPVIDRVEAWSRAEGERLAGHFAARKAGGFIRECHGDLHLANAVQVGEEVLAFDCIEFDPELRWIDVISDLSFLTMDLQAHGRADLAFVALDAYLQRSGEYAGLQVLRFYEIYRALVRALVTSLQARNHIEGNVPGAPDYQGCAARMMPGSRGGPRLMITRGLSGSGKSTVARRLLAQVGAVRVRSDVERKRLFGLGALQRSADHDLDLYTPEATRRTFERLATCARDGLRAGYPVIVDAAFLRRGERQAFRALAAELRVPFSILDCGASPDVLQQRLAARAAAGNDPSEADVSVLKRQVHWQEALDAHEQSRALEVATDQPVDYVALGERWLAAT